MHGFWNGGRALMVALLMGSTAFGSAFTGAAPAFAQEAEQTAYDIPVQSLGQALAAFSAQSGVDVVYGAAVPDTRSSAVSGWMSPGAALSRLLEGTGLTYRFTGPDSVRLERAPETASDDGSIRLGTLRVQGQSGGARGSGGSGSGTGRADPVERPYREPAAKAYIARETIERYRGSNPADIFRGTPGVMSGDARNAGSAIDVNIRGMQGMGRVNVTIDGAMNSTTMYQGYQGISSRTFVDPDFVAGVDITKGSHASSRGIAGTVAMRTLEARDLVAEGEGLGVRMKGELGNNTSKPEAGNRAGYRITNPIGSANNPSSGYGTAIASPDGMAKPGFLDATQGSASIVAALNEDNYEFLIGYAYRKRGNYHAGEHGPWAEPVSLGEQPFCYANGSCNPNLLYRDYIVNGGISNYRAGEEVLNTQLKTQSVLAKGTAKLADEHVLQLGFMWFDSEAGDRLASRLGTDTSQAEQQEQTVRAELTTLTAKYRWEPADNDLVHLQANLWYTDLKRRNPRRAGSTWSPYQPEDFGLPADHRVGTDNIMWGGDISNRSTFDTGQGDLTLEYGLSYLSEETEPSPHSQELEDWLTYRDGTRREIGVFVKGAWQPLDWLTLNAGLRYQHFWSKDRTTEDTVGNFTPGDQHGQELDEGGFSPFAGLTFEPWEDVQLYVNYSKAQRMPSLFESLTGFSTEFNPNLEPERSENWELGANVMRRDLLGQGDEAMVKLGYFNWDVSNYLARKWHAFETGAPYTYYGLYVYNIDSAKFEGLELSARYAIGGFEAELAANYYTGVEFCRTGHTCDDRSLYADYATNQIPPEYTVSLSASQKLFEEKLTLGGRVARTGPRAIGHGEITAQGLLSFISLIDWKPYTLVDLFAEYRITDNIRAAVRVENLTDRYYVDPLGLVNQPSPGRTGYASITLEF